MYVLRPLLITWEADKKIGAGVTFSRLEFIAMVNGVLW